MEAYRREMLEKRKKAREQGDEDEDKTEMNQESIEKLASQKRKQDRQRKRQEYEKVTNNFLFTDEQLMEVLSSSSEEEGE